MPKKAKANVVCTCNVIQILSENKITIDIDPLCPYHSHYMNTPMMSKEYIYKQIDFAPVKELKQCLKEIVYEWFVNGDGTVDFNKKVDADSLCMITDILVAHRFAPRVTGVEYEEPRKDDAITKMRRQLLD